MKTNNLNFMEAVEAMKEGKKVRRKICNFFESYKLDDTRNFIDDKGKRLNMSMVELENKWEIVEEEGFKIISYEEFLKREGISTFCGVPIIENKNTMISILKENSMDVKEENKMELKNINKKNLMEGKRKVEEERMNAEVKEAADQYREIVDSMDSLKRERKIINEQLEEYEKELKIFKEK